MRIKSKGVRTIKQTVEFDASPEEVYDLLMDSKKHSEFTDSECMIQNNVGGSFKIYDGYIKGSNILLEKNKKIVQNWHCTDLPSRHKTTVTFELEEKNGKTILHFTHENVPVSNYEDLEEGWKEHYWDRMKEYFKEH